MQIRAIDPGGTTGWGAYTDEKFYCGQFGPHDHHEELMNWLETWNTHGEVIICERFDFRGDDRSDINLMAREYIGVVKLFAQQRGVDVVWQWPFEGVGTRSFIQPSNLRSLGVWVKGGASEWIHAMDASRHLLYYMTAKPNDVVSREQRVDLLRKMGK